MNGREKQPRVGAGPAAGPNIFAYAAIFLWAGWWVLFGLSSAFSEGINGLNIIVHTAFPGFVFLGSGLLVLYRPRTGATLLLLEGLLIMVAYPVVAFGSISLTAVVFVELTMAAPPLVGGWLLWRNAG